MITPLSVLNHVFGHRDFRPPQDAVIDRTLRGGHSLVILPTGGGKSLCFQIPAIIFAHAADMSSVEKFSKAGRLTPVGQPPAPLSVVLSPLISLMKDQVDRLQDAGIAATYINSSLDREQREARYRDLTAGRYCLLYVTPERFRKPEFLDALARRSVRLLAIDEAHCISQWGHDFRPDYSCISRIRQQMGDPTTICLTATATPDVQRDILLQAGLSGFGQALNQCQLFHEGIERPNLTLDVESVWGLDEKTESIVRVANLWCGAMAKKLDSQRSASDVQQDDLDPLVLDTVEKPQARNLNSSGIVYFTLIRTLVEMSDRLRQRGLRHVCYHGDLPRQARKRIQDDFMKGRSPLVLATNAFGMGIDKEDIRFVIHADVPGSMEAYYQEIGRAGRDGFPAQCVLLYDQRDLATQMEFMKWSNPDADFYCRAYDLLVHEAESVRALGYDWLHERLCDRNRHDRRLDTVLAMFQRFGLIEDEMDLSKLQIQGILPETLSSAADREEKLRRDQMKLYALVEYVQSTERRAFLRSYFGTAVD